MIGRSAILFYMFGITLLLGCSKDNPTTPPGEDPNYTKADGINGGQFYDKFWAMETGFDQTDPDLATFNNYADFFRCKQCHGWDALGRKGGYVNRGPKTSRPNIADVNLYDLAKSRTASELFTLIKTGSNPSLRRGISADLSTYNPSSNSTVGDQMPDYSEILTDAQIWDIVKFLKTELINVNDLYDFSLSGTYPTGSIAVSNIGKGGTAADGDIYYSTKCATCHGADGTLILVDGNAYTAGSFIRKKPWEAQHKIKYGQLGTPMIDFNSNFQEIRNLYKALSDTTKYPNP